MNAVQTPLAMSAAAPILIMAGGTGGHVFPALAVADELRAADRQVVWLGTHRGLEARVVPAAGIDIEWITIAGVRGRGVPALLLAPFRIIRATWQALRVLRNRRPAAVLGMGGFVAGPGGLAAWLTRRPLLIHEQNAVAGTTNRLLSRIASRVFEAFPHSFPATTSRRAELHRQSRAPRDHRARTADAALRVARR
jgi:UDP-N-acetylglucosamine--N-acetylmuramyl-(pentapeptide) pyrophosphoryl-undecaprenol N-acetylglucosamine transferase